MAPNTNPLCLKIKKTSGYFENYKINNREAQLKQIQTSILNIIKQILYNLCINKVKCLNHKEVI